MLGTLLWASLPTLAQSFHPAVVVQQASPAPDESYLSKLFGTLQGKSSLDGPLPGYLTGPTGWLLAILATVFYGEAALAAILWILFRSDLVGIITASLLIALALAFTLPRRPRPIGLLVLAGLNLLLTTGLTLTIAFSESLYPILISILPAVGLLWLSIRYLLRRVKGNSQDKQDNLG